MKYLVSIFCFIFADAVFAETWNCGPATNGIYSDSVKCTLENGIFTITGNGNMSGYNVTTDNWLTTAPWKDYKGEITKIKIAEGVTGIGTLAMYDILSVSDIDIPDGVTYIGQGALAGNKLKSVEIPNTVVSIGVNAFETNLLETVTIPDSVKYLGMAFDNNPTLQKIYISDNVDTSNWDIAAFNYIGSIPDVICQGAKNICLSKMQKFIDAGSVSREQIIQAVEGECNSEQYYDGKQCKKILSDGSMPCAVGFKRDEYFCYRIRYTLPEADEATSNDNENMIEWIFE